MKRIEVHVGGNLREAAGRFATTWRAIERGERVREAPARLDFSVASEMLSAFSPKRLELLEHLAKNAGLSIRALARDLERDYKRVHGDVAALERLGLIERDEDGLLCAPYDELVIHAQLRAAA